MHFGAIFRTLGPEIDFGAQNALFRPKSLLGQKGLHFHQNSIGFISIRGMGTQKCIFAQKVHFCAQNAFSDPKCILSPKVVFEQNFHFFGSDRARRRKWLRVCEFVRVPKCTSCSKSHLWPKSHFLRQKCILSPKCTFGTKNASGPKSAPF